MDKRIFRKLAPAGAPALCLLVLLTLCSVPGTAQLTSEGNLFLTAASPGVPGAPTAHETFGHAFAVGDFDNDGFEDLAVGAPGAPTGDPQDALPGRVVVLYGAADGFDPFRSQRITQAACDGQNNCLGLPGAADEEDVFGYALAAGDFNGDSYDDLAISAPFANTGRGEVNVVFGGANGLDEAFSQLWDQDNEDITGQADESDLFGFSLAANDFNSDGYDDLAIGVVGESLKVGNDDVNGAGAVIVLYGTKSNGTTAVNHQFWSQSNNIDGDAAPLAFVGAALTSADFDRDGFDDLAISAPWAKVHDAEAAGRVHVLYGGAAAGLATDRQQFLQGGVHPEMQFGTSLSAGDINGDRFADLIIGAPWTKEGENERAGRAFIAFGVPGGISLVSVQNLTEAEPPLSHPGDGAQEDELLGFAVTAGDFNGDGFDDFVHAIPGQAIDGVDAAGAFRVMPGTALMAPGMPFGGATAAHAQYFAQGVDGIAEQGEEQDRVGLHWTFANVTGSIGRFGNCATTGDFNGDGFDDLIMGVPNEDLQDPDTGTITDAGGFHVLFGSRQPPPDMDRNLQALPGVVQQLQNALP